MANGAMEDQDQDVYGALEKNKNKTKVICADLLDFDCYLDLDF